MKTKIVKTVLIEATTKEKEAYKKFRDALPDQYYHRPQMRFRKKNLTPGKGQRPCSECADGVANTLCSFQGVCQAYVFYMMSRLQDLPKVL